MDTLEIVLTILGIVIIFISCKVVGNGEGQSEEVQRFIPSPDQLTEGEKERFREGLADIINNLKEEIIEQTDDHLSEISNEKIMSVTELSDQVLEKIKSNHEEVIFLYNMLNDKEKDLKALVREIDMSKSQAAKLGDETSNKVENVFDKQELKTDKSKLEDDKKEKINNNKQILNLYSQGKSIDDIAKELGIGHGEVRLVINLFK
mgnify:CR=1 FL=1